MTSNYKLSNVSNRVIVPEDVNQIKGTNSRYVVLKYNKDRLNEENVNTLGLYRSVVITNEENPQLVVFSPPKSVSYSKFVETHSPTECVAQEFIDGTMINVFWDDVELQWEIATRSHVGADNKFFMVPQDPKVDPSTGLTFKEMFMSTIFFVGLDLNILNKRRCYSFVLQHPHNRIVCPVPSPKLYLIECYLISDASIVSLEISKLKDDFKGTMVEFPRTYEFNSYEELEERFASKNPRNPTPYNVLGIVVKHPSTGERTKVRNPNYLYVKNLRGNNPRLDYRYVELRKEGRVSEFLRYFPEFSEYFLEYRKRIHTFTNQLYRNYVDCFILKKNKLSYFTAPYRNHMYKLHELYINTYSKMNKRIDKSETINYVNQLSVTWLLYCMNFFVVHSGNSESVKDVDEINESPVETVEYNPPQFHQNL
jgi:hypothetical protein